MKNEELSDLLRHHHLKVTPQRLQIMQSLHQFGHLTIDDMYEKVKNVHPNVSLATVYKNITLMTQNLLLEEVKIPSHKSVYEIAKSPHQHLYCESCGKIEDISINVASLRDAVAEQNRFSISYTCVMMRGICSECQNKADMSS